MEEADIKRCISIALENWPGNRRVKDNICYELADPYAWYYVAWLANAIVGFAGYRRSSINYDVYEFAWCNVLAEYRGRGIGRALTEYRIKMVEVSNGRAILLSTHLPELYERYGFRSLGIFKWWASDETHLMIKDML